MVTETAAGCTRADLVKCGDTECLCNCYNFDVHGQEPALPAGYFLVVARNPGATAEARAASIFKYYTPPSLMLRWLVPSAAGDSGHDVVPECAIEQALEKRHSSHGLSCVTALEEKADAFLLHKINVKEAAYRELARQEAQELQARRRRLWAAKNGIPPTSFLNVVQSSNCAQHDRPRSPQQAPLQQEQPLREDWPWARHREQHTSQRDDGEMRARDRSPTMALQDSMLANKRQRRDPVQRRGRKGGKPGIPVEQVDAVTGELVMCHASVSDACKAAGLKVGYMRHYIDKGVVYRNCLWRTVRPANDEKGQEPKRDWGISQTLAGPSTPDPVPGVGGTRLGRGRGRGRGRGGRVARGGKGLQDQGATGDAIGKAGLAVGMRNLAVSELSPSPGLLPALFQSQGGREGPESREEVDEEMNMLANMSDMSPLLTPLQEGSAEVDARGYVVTDGDAAAAGEMAWTLGSPICLNDARLSENVAPEIVSHSLDESANLAWQVESVPTLKGGQDEQDTTAPAPCAAKNGQEKGVLRKESFNGAGGPEAPRQKKKAVIGASFSAASSVPAVAPTGTLTSTPTAAPGPLGQSAREDADLKADATAAPSSGARLDTPSLHDQDLDEQLLQLMSVHGQPGGKCETGGVSSDGVASENDPHRWMLDAEGAGCLVDMSQSEAKGQIGSSETPCLDTTSGNPVSKLDSQEAGANACPIPDASPQPHSDETQPALAHSVEDVSGGAGRMVATCAETDAAAIAASASTTPATVSASKAGGSKVLPKIPRKMGKLLPKIPRKAGAPTPEARTAMHSNQPKIAAPTGKVTTACRLTAVDLTAGECNKLMLAAKPAVGGTTQQLYRALQTAAKEIAGEVGGVVGGLGSVVTSKHLEPLSDEDSGTRPGSPMGI